MVLNQGGFYKQDPLRKIPGPPLVPLFGNALQLDQPRLHIQLHEWAKEYGPVMKIKIFTKPIVVVNSIKAINEALITKGKQDYTFTHAEQRDNLVED